MSVQSLGQAMVQAGWLSTDRSRKRVSARSNSSPVPVPLSGVSGTAAKEKPKAHRDQLRQVFPFYQIKISRRTHSQKDTRPPVPKTGNAALSHDFKTLKYQQIEQEFLPKQAWGKKQQANPRDSAKENLGQDCALFLQSLHSIKQEEKQLHDSILHNLSSLRSLESVLDDNFRLVHCRLQQKAEKEVEKSGIDCGGVVGKEGVRRCAKCGLVVVTSDDTPAEYICGVCSSDSEHPIPFTSGYFAVEVQVVAKAVPKPPPKPPGGGQRSPASVGALTDRPASSLRRRNFLTPSKEVAGEVRVANRIISLGATEREYIYLPTSLGLAEFQPFELPKKKDQSNPITPSFNCHQHFQFNSSKDDWCHESLRRAVTERCEGISEVSETDLSRVATDFSTLEEKSDLEISFSDPTNTSIADVVDAPVSGAQLHAAAVIVKDLDDVMEQQLAALASSEDIGNVSNRLMETYGRHTRTLLRTLVATSPSHATAFEKCFKAFIHLCDQVLVRYKEAKQTLEQQKQNQQSEVSMVKEYQTQIALLQQSLTKTELKWKQKVESLTVLISKYEERIALYNKELEARDTPPMLTTLSPEALEFFTNEVAVTSPEKRRY